MKKLTLVLTVLLAVVFSSTAFAERLTAQQEYDLLERFKVDEKIKVMKALTSVVLKGPSQYEKDIPFRSVMLHSFNYDLKDIQVIAIAGKWFSSEQDTNKAYMMNENGVISIFYFDTGMSCKSNAWDDRLKSVCNEWDKTPSQMQTFVDVCHELSKDKDVCTGYARRINLLY